MNKVLLVLAVLFSFVLQAKIVKRPFMNLNQTIWQIDAATYESISSRKNDMGWSSLHGNGMYEYMGSGDNKEVLIVTSDPNIHMLHVMVTRENNKGQRQLVNKWSFGYGKKGSSTGRFKFPRGICIIPSPYFSSDGMLWVFVADEGNDRVVGLKYNTETHELFWGTTIGSSSLSKPKDVSCEWIDQSNGKLLMAIASSGDNRIAFYYISFSPNSIGISPLSNYQADFDNPTSVNIRHKASGHFYMFIADSDNHRIRRTDFSISGYNLDFYFTKVKDLPYDGEYYISSVGNDEKVVFLHDIDYTSFYAYDWNLQEILYGGQTEYSSYMSFMQGECLMSNEWSDNSGLEYYWLDSEFEEAGAVPNVFRIGQQDVVLNYVLTGGGKVTIKVYPQGSSTSIRTLEDQQPKYAGRNYAIWDGKNSSGQYVSAGNYDVKLWVEDNYSASEPYTLPDSTKSIRILASSSYTSFRTSFETTDSPSPYENSIVSNNFADSLEAEEVTAENGVSPHYGSYMYKITGKDTASDTIAGLVECKLFDTLNFEITDPTYLSFWVYGQDFPKYGMNGRIVLEGKLTSNTKLRDWVNYGQILDIHSHGINPDSMTLVSQDGKWHQYVYALTPAAGETLSVMSVTYRETAPFVDTGRFTVYFDDIQLTTYYPGNDLEWYPEHFANGTGSSHTNGDCNFDMDFYAYDLDPSAYSASYNFIFLTVDGNGDSQGGGSCCECLDTDTVWITPSPGPGIKLRIPDKSSSVNSSSKISWWQYDRAHALVLGAKLRESDNDTNWLYWAWNASNHWSQTGYVDMGDDGHITKYNQWEGPFLRGIVEDYVAEYGSTPIEVLDLRVAHYCRSDWDGDKGGIIKDLYLGGVGGGVIDTIPKDSIPDPVRAPVVIETGRDARLMTISADIGLVRVQEPDPKEYPMGWGLGEGIAPEECELYLSRDGGGSFDKIADGISPGTKQPIDTIIIDDTLQTVRYFWRGSYTWNVASPPTGDAVMKLVVIDSNSNTWEYLSNHFQIHIPSAMYRPLEGNANLVAYKATTAGGFFLTWTTNGSTDTTDRYILYLRSSDGITWDTLDNPDEGHRPTLLLSSQTNPQVVVYNDTAGRLLSKRYDSYGQDWTSAIDITPLSAAGTKFTANCVMGLSDTVHFAMFADSASVKTTVLYAKKKFPFGPPTGLVPYTLGTYTYDAPEHYAPSIAMDKNNRPHLAYRIGNQVHYSYYDGSRWSYETFDSDTTCEPSVACEGNNVFILYRNTSGSLVRALGYLDGTISSTCEILASSGAISDPRLVGGSVVVFTDEEDTTSREIRLSQYDAETNAFSYPFLISDVERNAYSPQGIALGDTCLWLLWTEDRGTHNKIAYLALEPLYDYPVTEMDAGCAPTPFTSYRDAADTISGTTVDVGQDSLVYSFTGLNSGEQHTAIMEFFFEDTSVTGTNYVVVCGNVQDTVEIEEGYVNQVYCGISDGYSTIPLKVYAADSIAAQLSRVVIYEGADTTGIMGMMGIAEQGGKIPVRFALYQPFPNPFTTSTTIRYALPYACRVKLTVYDISGRRVCALENGFKDAGIHTLQWDGRDDNNVALSSGVYFIRFEADDYTESKKTVFLH